MNQPILNNCDDLTDAKVAHVFFKICLFKNGQCVVDEQLEAIEKIQDCIRKLSGALRLLDRSFTGGPLVEAFEGKKRICKLVLIKGGKDGDSFAKKGV